MREEAEGVLPQEAEAEVHRPAVAEAVLPAFLAEEVPPAAAQVLAQVVVAVPPYPGEGGGSLPVVAAVRPSLEALPRVRPSLVVPQVGPSHRDAVASKGAAVLVRGDLPYQEDPCQAARDQGDTPVVPLAHQGLASRVAVDPVLAAPAASTEVEDLPEMAAVHLVLGDHPYPYPCPEEEESPAVVRPSLEALREVLAASMEVVDPALAVLRGEEDPQADLAAATAAAVLAQVAAAVPPYPGEGAGSLPVAAAVPPYLEGGEGSPLEEVAVVLPCPGEGEGSLQEVAAAFRS